MSKKLYIGNLSYEVTDEDLNQLFSQCGQVTQATVIKDKATGRSKGFGFVEMPNDDEAMHAISRMRGHDVKGRQIQVDEAQEKEVGVKSRPTGNRPSGGGKDRSRDRRNF